MYTPLLDDLRRVERNLTHHAPHGSQTSRYDSIRAQVRVLAHRLLTFCPPSRELSLSLTHLEEAVFWANASIARNENPPDDTPAAA